MEVDFKMSSRVVDKEEEKQKDNYELPQYFNKLELSPEQKDRLVAEIFAEFKAIKEERRTEGLDEKWDALDNQYDGKMQENASMQFNLHKHTTKIKVDAVDRAINQAYNESDPRYTISPRPEFSKKGGYDICEKQTDFLDYKIDVVIPLDEANALTHHSSTTKGTGVKEWWYEIERVKRVREETYKGDPKQINQNGQLVTVNKGLEEFVKAYQEQIEKDPDKYLKYIQRLQEGKEINILVEYMEVVYNDPYPEYVDLKDFYVRLATKGYRGLCTTKLIVRRKNYTYWELKKEEKKNNFENVDELTYEDTDDKERKQKDNFANEDYDILKCTYFFKMNPDDEDEEETRVVCWISEEKETYLGGITYPFPNIGCNYVPGYIKKKKTGFYQPGIAEDLTDSNIAEDALLNFLLTGLYITNTVTPIVTEGSVTEQQFLEKRFTHGIPIQKERGEEKIDFLQNYMERLDARSIMGALEYLAKNDDDVTRVSSLTTGRESEIDPTAPAAKTIALLKQSGLGVKEYLTMLTPSFNEDANIILQMYYQISRQGQQYKRRSAAVVGEDPFATISRSEMIARTNIQAQAASFDFEKMNEKREDLVLYQVLRQELLIQKRPEAVLELVKTFVKSWSKKWKNKADILLPSLSQFKKEQLMTAIQAVKMYAERKQQEAKVTGVPVEMSAKEFLPLMSDLLAMTTTPPSKEAVKAQKGK